jgi:hypothetical protein
MERMDAHVWAPLDRAIALLSDVREEAASSLGLGNVVEDQLVRCRALHCWLVTQRSVAAWIAGVGGYMEATTDDERSRTRTLVRQMMEEELENSRRLLELLDSGVAFMAITDRAETPLIYGENLRESIRKRIALMDAHRDDEPFIDPAYMERQAGMPA